MKNLFHPDDFIEEPTLLKDLEADILEECTKIGRVDKVRVESARCNEPLFSSAICTAQQDRFLLNCITPAGSSICGQCRRSCVGQV